MMKGRLGYKAANLLCYLSLSYFSLAGCAPNNSPASLPSVETPSYTIEESKTSGTGPSIDGEFRQILDEYIKLNARLERIAARLKSANADLCDNIEADIGVSTHTVYDYPPELRSAARHFFKVGPDLSRRTVRTDSPAYAAGLRAGDKIIRINTQSLTETPPFTDPALSGIIADAQFHEQLDKLVQQNKSAELEYKRENKSSTVTLTPRAQCQLPVTLFFSENVNGHYINGEIWMTSGLLREVKEDAEVAYILAHEMAHALTDKGDYETAKRTAKIELEADRVGLILLARAGYDPSKLARFWAKQIDIFDGGEISSDTHPDLDQRAHNYALTLSYIQAAQNDDKALMSLITAP